MMAVRFIRGMSPYNTGDRAGFADEYAQGLVNRGFAEYVKEQEDEEELEYMTVVELKEKAEELGIYYTAKDRKADLIEKLRG